MLQALLLLRRPSLLSVTTRRLLSGKAYTKTHEWLDTDGRVGISNFAQNELGDVVYVELPQIGTTLKAGDTFGSVESVKAASDVYAPVSGEVIDTNAALKDEPGVVNEDAEGKGWMIKLKVGADAAAEKEALLDAKAYAAHSQK